MRTRSCNLLLRQAGSEQPVVLGNWAYLQLHLSNFQASRNPRAIHRQNNISRLKRIPFKANSIFTRPSLYPIPPNSTWRNVISTKQTNIVLAIRITSTLECKTCEQVNKVT